MGKGNLYVDAIIHDFYQSTDSVIGCSSLRYDMRATSMPAIPGLSTTPGTPVFPRHQRLHRLAGGPSPHWKSGDLRSVIAFSIQSLDKSLDKCRIQVEDEVPVSKHMDSRYSWVVCVAAFLAHFLALGFAYSLGVYYAVFLQVFEESASVTSLISSLNFGTLCVVGPIASIMISNFGTRITIISGTLLSTAGLVISSAMNDVHMLVITLGVITGAGLGLIFASAIVVISLYFNKWRSIAMGLSMSGAGVGTIVFPWLTRYLVEQYSWRGALLLTAAINLHVCVAGMIMRPIPAPNTQKQYKTNTDLTHHIKKPQWANFHLSIFTKGPYLLLCLNCFLYTFGMSVVYTHVGAYAASMQLGHHSGKVIISSLGISNLLGRISLGCAGNASNVNVTLLFVISYFLSGLAIICSGIWTSFVGLTVAMIVFGFFSGAFGPLLSEVTCLIVGAARFNHGYGYLMVFMALGNAIGAPCAGVLYETTSIYSSSFYLGGSVLLFSSIVLLPAIPRKTQIIPDEVQIYHKHKDHLLNHKDQLITRLGISNQSVDCIISSV